MCWTRWTIRPLLFLVFPMRLLAMEVEYVQSDDHVFSSEERQSIQAMTNSIESEVKLFLPRLPDTVWLEVRAEALPYSSTGGTGAAIGVNRIAWVVDTSRSEGVVTIANRTLRAVLFHEFHHLARGCSQGGARYRTFIDGAVCEGMATAFARDFAGSIQSWAKYPPEVSSWFDEVKDLPASATTGEWMFFHSAGRVRIGYKVGTYLVDRAMEATGKTSAELTNISSEELVKMAGYEY